MPSEPKVFCLGMTKTGTTSLSAALRMLGRSCCHHMHGAHRGRDLIEKALSEGRPLLSHMPNYAAYSDMALYEYLEILDAEHPGSKFIFTTREKERWLVSLLAHNERHEPTSTADQRVTDQAAQAAWSLEWERVETLVADYFRDRPGDLVTMDIAAGDGWNVLCPFLGEAVPNVPFPHRNKKPRGPVQGALAAIRRWVSPC